jgi:hypothetical protein
VIRSLLNTRPAFGFNTLLGTSAYTFFRDPRSDCNDTGLDRANTIPSVGCSLSEPWLPEISRIIVDFKRRTGTNIIFIEQNLDLIRAIALRCCVVEKRRIVAEINLHELDNRETILKYLAV